MRYKDSIVISTAPTERQVRDLLWAEINNLFIKSKTNLGGKTRSTGFSFAPRWFATGITTTSGNEEDSAVRFQGYHSKHILVIMDEAVGIHPAIWEAVDGITNSDNAKILAVGNPSTPNCAFKKHLDSGEWNVLTVSALNHPNVLEKREVVPGAVSYRWVKDKIKRWCREISSGSLESSVSSESVFQFEGKYYKPNNLFLWKILGEFPKESVDSLISSHQVQEAMR
jgi:hypothetical protein